MKTVYIPAGATYNYETLVTDDVIIPRASARHERSESEAYFRQRVYYRR